MVNLISLDLDGTVLQPGEARLSLKVSSVINQALGKGVKVLINSGRNLMNILDICNDVEIDQLSFAADSGNVLAFDGQVRTVSTVQESVIRDILTYIKDNELCDLLLSTSQGMFFRKGSIILKDRNDITVNSYSLLPDWNLLPKDIARASVYMFSKTRAVQKVLYSDIRDIIGDKGLVYLTTKNTVDVISPNTTKGTALEEWVKHYGLKREDVRIYSLGDSQSDIPMLKYADVGYIKYSNSDYLMSYNFKKYVDACDVLESVMREVEFGLNKVQDNSVFLRY